MELENNKETTADTEIRESERRLIQKELFRLEDQKDAAEQRFKAMFENALVGLFRAEVKTKKLTDANLEAARIFGFANPEELVFWVNKEIGYFSYFRQIPNPDQLNAGEPHTFSAKTKRRDGFEFWAQFSVRYTGNDKYLEGAIKDITDQVESMESLKAAKAEAEEANEAKSRFLATMSHEIRTPLNGIIGFAEILQERNDPRSRDFSRKILDESDRLMILINQLLDFSKLEANKISLESIPFDLHQILDEVEVSFHKTISMNGLSYIRDMEPDLPQWYLGDPMRFRQVISNLLSNALKFTKDGGVILKIRKVGINEESSPLVKFEVIDTGIGIPDEKKDAIFVSFEQADSSISRKYGGTGLGVPICRELVGLMGGSLMLESTVGVGSNFHFTIPMPLSADTMNAVPAQKKLSKDRVDLLSGIRVLVVEDYETNREIARHHMEKAGCEVFFAEHGKEALEVIEDSAAFDLILMDMHMPVMDGLEATEKLRKLGLNTPIIGMTASAYAEDRVRCLEAGMDDFLSKPLRRGQMLAKAIDWVESGGLVAGKLGGDTGIALTGTAVFRYNDFLDELDGSVDLAKELLSGFADDTRSRLDSLDQAIADAELEVLHRHAHSIKGGALNVTADKLAGTALVLEKAAKEEASSDVLKIALADVRDSFGHFIEAWKDSTQHDETDEGQSGPL